MRDPGLDQNERINKVRLLLWELIKLNPQYNNNDWCAAYMGQIAIAFQQKYTFEEFQEEMERMTSYYKHLWENK